LVHNKDVREDNLEQILGDQIRRRFGELIAWAEGHKAKGYHGPWRAHIAPIGSRFAKPMRPAYKFLMHSKHVPSLGQCVVGMARYLTRTKPPEKQQAIIAYVGCRQARLPGSTSSWLTCYAASVGFGIAMFATLAARPCGRSRRSQDVNSESR
jgi:hypothetical protein